MLSKIPNTDSNEQGTYFIHFINDIVHFYKLLYDKHINRDICQF